jgi:hypothetical protein
MWNYKGQFADVDIASKIPTSTTLDLLSRCLKFVKVQQHAAQEHEMVSIAASLLDLPVSHSSTAVQVRLNQILEINELQDILLSLAQHNSKLCDELLHKILFGEAQHSVHALFAGILAAISCNELFQGDCAA